MCQQPAASTSLGGEEGQAEKRRQAINIHSRQFLRIIEKRVIAGGLRRVNEH